MDIKHKISGRKITLRDITDGNILDFDFCRFENVVCPEANFHSASCQHSEFFHTVMPLSNINGVNFFMSRMVNSDFHGSNFIESDIRSTIFSSVNLSGCDFTGALIDYRTWFAGCILEGCKIEFLEEMRLSHFLTIRFGYLPENLCNEILRRSDCFIDGQNLENERGDSISIDCPSWGPEPATMNNNDLMIEICKYKGWGIKNILPCTN